MKLFDISTGPTPEKISQLCRSRFGVEIDFDSLSPGRAQHLSQRLSESLQGLRRQYGVHTTQHNPRYMEMLTIKEGIDRWLGQHRRSLSESETAQAEVILAAKNMVEELQGMLEKLGQMQNEDLVAVVDAARDQIGMQQAQQFRDTVSASLTELLGSVQQHYETLNMAARTLAGEPVEAAPQMAEPGAVPAEPQADEFNAADAAAGGTEPMGRERR
jgi:hypothetical protein